MQNAFIPSVLRGLTVAGLALTVAHAQPAEAPPTGQTGTYVDSQGCAWQPVEVGAQVAWAALLRGDGSPLCGMVPSVPVETIASTPASPADMPAHEAASAPENDGASVAEKETEVASATEAESPIGADAQDTPAMQTATAAPVAAAEQTPETAVPVDVSRTQTRRPSFPQPGFYVQVGAFREPVNADRAVTFMQGLGYGALRQTSKAKVKPLQIIYAGPFVDKPSASAARRQVGKIGYGDAFIWGPK